jgi:DNA-binding XRE family transcriptional regulator
MELAELKSNDEVLAAALDADPAFRAEWTRTAEARCVATALVRYRAQHELSEHDLAQLLRVSDQDVASLELGETNPPVPLRGLVERQLRGPRDPGVGPGY